MSETSTSNTNAAAKPWPKEQSWIKDVLSKSGTEVVQISPNKAVKITKKMVKQHEKNSQKNTMVYYPSTPLIIKSEQSSQAQMCTADRNLHEPQQLPSATSNSYMINNVNITTLQHHFQQQQQQQQQHQQQQQQQHQHQQHHHVTHNINSTSITISHPQQQQQQQYLTNIKTELLPPGITVYATTQPASVTSKSAKPSNPTATKNNVGSSVTVSPTTRKTNTTKAQFKCEQCGMTFGSKSAHTSHTKSHGKSGKLVVMSIGSISENDGVNASVSAAGLEVNDVGLPKSPQIKPNITATANGGDPYQCNVCQKTFAVPARLIRHYRTHTGERPFECEFCRKLFSVKENLQVHRRIHTKERPYICSVCERGFEHSGKLHRHMRIHTGERPHKCSVCEKTFIQSGQLVIHMRTHTGEKPYKCPVEGCGKGFTCSKQLKVHSRSHTGEKPYQCDICFRDFGYNHVLKLHRAGHYGSKCYKCGICEETFNSKKEMDTHIKGHGNKMHEDDVHANGTVSSVSTSSGVETNSEPNSPQYNSSSLATAAPTTANKTTPKPRKQRKFKQNSKPTVGLVSPGSPGSHISSSMSPSSSNASGSRLSAASPTSSSASPTMLLSLEADHHSRDSGVASGSMLCNNTRQLAAASLVDLRHQGGFPTLDEMPTDLTVTQNHHIKEEQQLQLPKNYQHKSQHISYHYQSISSPQQQHNLQQQQQYHYLSTCTSPSHATDLHQTSTTATQQHHLLYDQQPTINPALLEAATIASRREDDVQQAAIQIMQLHHSQQKSNSNQLCPDLQHNLSNTAHHKPQHENSQVAVVKTMVGSNLPENLIEHYARDELTRQVGGFSKGHAPVPKFEPSLHDNDIILRQVEAAIAPLRSSNSPDRSSSPESDVMLMADRDVMTLPLRKRKLYMSDCNESGDNENSNNSNKHLNHKVMRHSSVIQFAKAS